MTDFRAVEKFRLNFVNNDGHTERVSVQISMDGLKILTIEGGRTIKSYELSHISRWQSRGSSLVLYTKTTGDIEERQVTFQGDEHTIRSALDTLTCCCMQLCEILQSKKTDNDKETANNLHALVQGGGKKKTALPSADDVEYWTGAEKQGWLMSQGEQLKMWRKRWFVMKQGYLFRFLNSTVSESTKPRGVVDLSKIQDVKEARSATGRANSFQLKTSSGLSVSYVAETETELVEWMSAIEGAMQKICKLVAGVEDVPVKETKTVRFQSNDWVKQLEKSFDNVNTSTGHKDKSASSSAIVNVVGYESAPGAPTSGNYGGQYSSAPAARSTSLNYSQISGIAGVVGGSSGQGGDGYGDDLLLNYGSASDYNRNQGQGQTYGGTAAPAASTSYMPQPDYYSNYSQPTLPSYGSGGQSGYGHSTQPVYSSTAQINYGAPGAQASYGQQPQSVDVMQSAPPAQSAYSQGVQPNYGYGQQSQQPIATATSLLDMVPQQQPAYPYFQHSPAAQQQVPVQHAAPSAAPTATWQVHHTAEGRPYYYNVSTGTTQWERPVGLAM